ncbi:sensor histidine kinase [Lactococcus insecticola]|nr:HAMP domain-containing sensor histidine kinase [Lactococcus insecticola]
MKKIKPFKSIHVKQFWKSDSRNFLHFFVVFTIIFAALTMIILQTLTTGIYKTTDENIANLTKNPQMLATLALRGSSESNATDASQAKNQSDDTAAQTPPVHVTNFTPNQTVLLYDKNGKILNANTDLTTATVAADAIFRKSSVGKLNRVTIANPYGKDMLYRTKLLKVHFTGVSTNIAYIQIFVNVDQLSESLARSQVVILTTMVVFWVISLGASIYLSRWSMKPVIAAYEKQKNFVENASHELRTPLAILQNRLELLFQRPMATIIDESENVSQSLAEVRNMRILTSNLLNLAKRDDGIKPVYTQVTRHYFEKIFENYAMLAENAGKTFSSELQLDGNVKLDEALIKQLLTILFDNAMKYTDDDGQINIRVEKVSQNLILTTSDNGPGISDDDKKKIFDRFYRVDKARTRQTGGFGLGLSLAQQIVQSCNGKIEVHDNKPKGSQFIVKMKAV